MGISFSDGQQSKFSVICHCLSVAAYRMVLFFAMRGDLADNSLHEASDARRSTMSAKN
jgi:hypothetical protein